MEKWWVPCQWDWVESDRNPCRNCSSSDVGGNPTHLCSHALDHEHDPEWENVK